MTAVAVLDIPKQERDTEARIAELSSKRAELALDVLTDEALRPELEATERDLFAAEREAARLVEAQAEVERREAAALQDEADSEREATLKRARALQPRREEAAKAIDEAAEAFGAAVSKWAAICTQQQSELSQVVANQQTARACRPLGFLVEAALVRAMDGLDPDPRSIDMFDRLGFIPVAHRKPLAESDAGMTAAAGDLIGSGSRRKARA